VSFALLLGRIYANGTNRYKEREQGDFLGLNNTPILQDIFTIGGEKSTKSPFFA